MKQMTIEEVSKRFAELTGTKEWNMYLMDVSIKLNGMTIITGIHERAIRQLVLHQTESGGERRPAKISLDYTQRTRDKLAKELDALKKSLETPKGDPVPPHPTPDEKALMDLIVNTVGFKDVDKYNFSLMATFHDDTKVYTTDMNAYDYTFLWLFLLLKYSALNENKVLRLHEPSAGVHPVIAYRLGGLLSLIQEKTKVKVLLSSNDPSLLSGIIDGYSAVKDLDSPNKRINLYVCVKDNQVTKDLVYRFKEAPFDEVHKALAQHSK